MIYLLLLTYFTACFSAIVNDEVKNMPHFPTNLNFSMYSGLLSLPNTTDKSIHYILLTKAGEKSTKNDAPLVLWLNGGPGCSSLDGFLIENGPFVLENGQKKLNGTFNAWSWNQFANILYLESPAGVGFSPADLKKNTYDDPTTTKDNYDALVTFFRGFPELLNNNFWVSGESYAGVYVPWLAAYIAKENQKSGSVFMNLQGVMVGNGVASRKGSPFTAIDFYAGHYLIPEELQEKVHAVCKPDTSAPACKSALTEVSKLTAMTNPYDIYRYCFRDDGRGFNEEGWLDNPWIPSFYYDLAEANVTSKDASAKAAIRVPCLDTNGIHSYFNLPEVKEALHVDKKTEWSICSGEVNQHYERNPNVSEQKYQELMDQHYKILIYSGDTDAAVPYTSTLYWIQSLKLAVKDEWRPWYLGNQVAGFVESYNELTFATVKGVGHQVPAWKREESYILIESFINDKELPKKQKSVKKDRLIEL